MRLQEVVWCLTSHMRFPTSWSWVKLQEGILEGVVKLHDGSLVSTAVAVVGGGEDGDHVPVVRPVVPLHDQLVGPGHICSGDKFWEYFHLLTCTAYLEMSVRPFEWLKVSEMSCPKV